MPGANGTKLDGSKTVWKNGKNERIDIENFDPGNIHYHEPDNTKWYLDPNEKREEYQHPKKYRSY